MPVNAATLDLIREFEGFVPNWYPDPAHGWKVPTCCYGHTDAAGEPKYVFTKTTHFTLSDGAAILRRDLVAVEKQVSALVTVPLNANQFGAIISFTFNLGAANLKRSALLRHLNARQYKMAAGQFGRWTKANGKTLAGLVRRRAAEAALFRRGT